MSASTGPYTGVARGRLPVPTWVRVVALLAVLALVVVVMALFFNLPAAIGGKQEGGSVQWTPGAALSLPPPASPAPAAPAAPAPSVPAPAPAPSAAPAARPMRVWGDGQQNILPRMPADASSKPTEGQRRRAGNDGADGTVDGSGEGDGGTEYGKRLQPTKTATYEAGVYKDYSLLLPEGASFECLPQSPADTQLVGGITCFAGEDVWSADGSNILIDKFAVVTGEIQRGLEAGQNRAFFLWRRVRSGRVHATLNSPATDELGQMGASGVVNEHFWKRIKGAVLLTAVETASGAAQALAARGGRGNTYLNFNQGASLAEQLLAHDINIPATLYRGQAWPLRVYVQHDIQFRRAYGNRLAAGR